jgi:hypothetical protein
MPLSWNEIKTRAAAFVLEWKDSQTVREKAEAQTFETEFLKIFGIERKKVALFEHEVHFWDSSPSKEGGERGYIDQFKHWDPVNIEAAEKMGELHNRLKEIGYSGHQLELYLFCETLSYKSWKTSILPTYWQYIYCHT